MELTYAAYECSYISHYIMYTLTLQTFLLFCVKRTNLYKDSCPNFTVLYLYLAASIYTLFPYLYTTQLCIQSTETAWAHLKVVSSFTSSHYLWRSLGPFILPVQKGGRKTSIIIMYWLARRDPVKCIYIVSP